MTDKTTRICDCELGHNGLGMATRECDCAERKIASLWEWHSQCVERADKAKIVRDMKAWEYWSRAAAETLVELS